MEQNDSPLRLTESQVIHTLTNGKMVETGLLPYSSNHSFLVTVTDGDLTLPAVYKPRRGESPLWDFERGSLCLRETAAFHISHDLKWDLVPPTVLREGTRGIGSVQFFVSNDAEDHYFTIQADARFADPLRKLALFDFIINNADRKSGHCLIDSDGRLWAIDHGVCFHTEYKLRTVIWEFSEEPIDAPLLDALKQFHARLLDEDSELCNTLCQLISRNERMTLIERTEILLQTHRFPAPFAHRRNYPWPPI